MTLAGGVLGGSALLCAGGGATAMIQPRVKLAEPTCGIEETDGARVLVAYASRTGSTAGVAETVADTLCTGDVQVDVRQAKNLSDISGYRGVIVGSAVYMGRWMPEAIKFLETHRDALRNLPVAFYTVCLTMKDDTEENRLTVGAYADLARDTVEPIDVGLFAGWLQNDRLSLAYRLIIKIMGMEQGDYRDWSAKRAWATELAPYLAVQ